MKKYFLLAIIGISLLIATSSCKKDEDDTQPQPIATGQTGTLTIYLVDKYTNLPDTGVSVSLFYDYNFSPNENIVGSYSTLDALQNKITDSQGKIDFGELNSGNYFLDFGTYKPQVQIIAGRNNIYTIKN